ncbi:MAG TPA: MerR family DNA-binding transcriptional regulator [Gemmatimonadota bacterium]|nr:MerR family DNA-binding transcriptional regulator [Gemmatimonadota bacterium]
MKTAAARPLTPDERATITAALPSIRRAAPDAAGIIARLVDDVPGPETKPRRRYASIAEVATAFSVTEQTIRNWADRGWLPCDRTPAGTRRIPRSVLASHEALNRARPPMPDLTPAQAEAILNAPRRGR